MNPLSASILIFLIAVVLGAPRRYALLGMAAGILYLTQYASIDIFGFNIFPSRFLEIAAFVRVTARREFSFAHLNGIDRIFLLLYSYITTVFLLRSNESQAYQIGLFVDATLGYFSFRGLIGDMEDFQWFLRAFVIILIPYVALLFVEMWTSRNPFSVLGGTLPEHMFREGRVRCNGSSREPSILGSLGASFLPLYIGLCFSRPQRILATIGIILCMAIVVLANSGSPLAFAAMGPVGWLLWPMREKMHFTRRGMLALLVLLSMFMQAPIWYLPVKISFLTGGNAFHRSYLMDVAFQDLGKWWVWGMPISDTSGWFPYTLGAADQADITNQYIAFGLSAGLMAIVLFICLLVRAFKSLGGKLAALRSSSITPTESEYLLWGLGVMLAGHIANLTSICYFDQFCLIWFMQLVFISNYTEESAQFPVPSAIPMPERHG